MTALIDKDDAIARRKRRQRLRTLRTQQDGLQASYDASADAKQSELDVLLEVESPSPEQLVAIDALTASIAALRASAARIRAELAGGLP